MVIELNRTPSKRQLRQFAASLVLGAAVVGTYWRAELIDAGVSASWFWLGGGLAAALALVAAWRPRLLRPLFVGVSILTFPIGLIVSEVLLLTVFVGVFVPVSLLFRLVGRDALERRLAPDRHSYWRRRARPDDGADYFRQS